MALPSAGTPSRSSTLTDPLRHRAPSPRNEERGLFQFSARNFIGRVDVRDEVCILVDMNEIAIARLFLTFLAALGSADAALVRNAVTRLAKGDEAPMKLEGTAWSVILAGSQAILVWETGTTPIVAHVLPFAEAAAWADSHELRVNPATGALETITR